MDWLITFQLIPLKRIVYNLLLHLPNNMKKHCEIREGSKYLTICSNLLPSLYSFNASRYSFSAIFHLVMVRWKSQKETALWAAPCIYFVCAIENKVSCKSLEKLILFFSAKVFSHAGIVRFFLTAFSPYLSS